MTWHPNRNAKDKRFETKETLVNHFHLMDGKEYISLTSLVEEDTIIVLSREEFDEIVTKIQGKSV